MYLAPPGLSTKGKTLKTGKATFEIRSGKLGRWQNP